MKVRTPFTEPKIGTKSYDRTKRTDKSKSHIMVTDSLTNVRARFHINQKKLGHGHYGVVRKCMDRETNEWYAIKSIRKTKVEKIEQLKREIDILREVKHPNIIRLKEVHEDKRYLHLITELCTGGELFDRIIEMTKTSDGHFSEDDASRLVRSIIGAIAYCHDVKGIVHRDLKPENFLYATPGVDAPIKIIDFGLSRYDPNAKFGFMQTKVGTPYYIAPEVLDGEYTKSCDIWSIGVITYILLCGYPPFYGDTQPIIFQSVRKGNFDFPSPEWDTISDSAKDFIRCLLNVDPSLRPSASGALNHIWIRQQLVEIPHMRPQRTGPGHNRRRSIDFAKHLAVQKLKKVALGYIVSKLTVAEVGNLDEMFQCIDFNNDGIMTLQDVDRALREGDFSADLHEQLRLLHEELSLSGEDELDREDFLASMIDKNILVREDKIRMAFEHFKHSDDDDTESLQLSDLVRVLGAEAQAQEIVCAIDTNGDGHISYEEFLSMMAKDDDYNLFRAVLY